MSALWPLARRLRMTLQRPNLTQLSGPNSAGREMRGSHSGKSLVESRLAR
jgi:hypothetical protein